LNPGHLIENIERCQMSYKALGTKS